MAGGEVGMRLHILLHHAGRALGGIYDGHALGHNAPQHRRDERIVSAAEEKGVGGLKSVRERLFEIDARNLFGHRMVHPSFFDKGDEQRASGFAGVHAVGFESFLVGVTVDCGFGGDDDDGFVYAGWPAAALGLRVRPRRPRECA